MKSLFFAFLVLGLGYPLTVAAGGFDCATALPNKRATEVIGQVESRYRTIHSVSADFVQSSYFAGLEQSDLSKGRVFFKSPGLMNWEYKQPEEKRFVADGSKIWFYEPLEKQVTVSDFKKTFTSELPVSFLLGLGTLSDKFELKSACTTDAGVLLDLQPKETDPGLQKFFLLVDAVDFSPMGARVIDIGGTETTITLLGTVFNENIPASAFTFDPPKGTYIDNRLTSQIPPPNEINEETLVKNSTRDE